MEALIQVSDPKVTHNPKVHLILERYENAEELKAIIEKYKRNFNKVKVIRIAPTIKIEKRRVLIVNSA